MKSKKGKFGRILVFIVMTMVLIYFALNTTLIKPSMGSRLARITAVNYLAGNFSLDSTPEDTRASMLRLNKFKKLPRGTFVERTEVKGMAAEWVRAPNVPESKKVVLYLHGGGFYSGSCDTHRDLAVRISGAGNIPVFMPEYRLAPENQYPAANEDCLNSYLWLLEQGYKPSQIAIGGDSAGGCLTLMTLISIRDQGHPLPGAAFLLSPLTDAINFDGESYQTRAGADPWFKPEVIPSHIERYTKNLTEKPPILSPLNNNLEGLPPMLIQVGRDEILLSDSTRLAERAKDAGVDAALEVWDDMWHVFQAFAVIVPESRQAIANIGDFLQARLSEV